ncbi:MAG: glycoside hydrolase family 28 protein [Ginsengibacter sp.]
MNLSFQAKLNIIFFLLAAFFFLPKDINAQEKNADWYISNAPFKMPEVIVPRFADHSFSIKDFGGVNDGNTLNTGAFKKTIDACVAAGGGKVVVPPGLWLTGPIQLQSDINLCVEKGALIIFTKDHSQYPMIKASSKTGNIVTASPIYGYDLKNIAITGEGIIDGGGDSWRPVKKEKTTAAQWKDFTSSGGAISNDGNIWWPTKEAMDGEEYLKNLKKNKPDPVADDYLPARDYLRPYMLYLINCDNILLENITLRNSPKFVFYPNSCTNLTMRHVNIFNEWWAQNGDGIDISRCKNVFVYRCTVSAGDDGICMKSGGVKKDDSSFGLENIVIAECVVYHAHGGFVIGSNTDGGMQNIFVSNCNYIGTDVGIRVKSNAGRGGLVKNIFIRNIYMSGIRNEAISFNTYYEDVPAGSVKKNANNIIDTKTPLFTDFYFDSIYCTSAKTAIAITGLPGTPVQKINFDNMEITADNGFVATNASDINLNNVKIISLHDPVYQFNNVKNITINKGYLPASFKTFYKADEKSTGIHINETDLKKKN